MESHETSAKQTEESHGSTALQNDGNEEKKERFLDILRAAPYRELWLYLLGVTAFLRAPPALARTVDWPALGARCKPWARHPANAALLVWLAFVGAGVAFVLLLMTGALDSAVPDASRRRRWTEAANQVLNALFTVMCVYQHPRLCHHLALLLRWRATDAAELRRVYCNTNKNAAGAGPGRPPRRERLHVAVVLALLHATCLAQYAYCALFWVFNSETRPDWAVNVCMALGLGFPVAAALYMFYGPLARGVKANHGDEEAAAAVDEDKSMMAVNDARCRVVVSSAATKAEWAGGLLDIADNPAVAAVSVACTFCVFGWNMERLGFGNACVHALTFALLCAAPALVFAVAALNVHDAAAMGPLVAAAGALLSVLGLLYGGFWRARMRIRLALPGDDRCSSMCGAGWPAAADYVKWLLCAPCALAQEVRTANLYHYDVEEGSVSLEEAPPAMTPLDRDGRVVPFTADSNAVAVHAPPVPPMVQEGGQHVDGLQTHT